MIDSGDVKNPLFLYFGEMDQRSIFRGPVTPSASFSAHLIAIFIFVHREPRCFLPRSF